jgi:hypothetical protein
LNLLNFILPILFLLVIAFSIWGAFERSCFTRFEGSLKRGIMIWADPLPWETRQFLETMVEPIYTEQGFIRKEGREVLVAPQKTAWSLFRRRDQWVYTLYINLSDPHSQLELRMPWSTLISMIILVPIILATFLIGFYSSFIKQGFQFSLFCLLPALVPLIFVAATLINHYRERRRLLDMLHNAVNKIS